MKIECPICTYNDHEDYFTGFYGEMECPNCGWMEKEVPSTTKGGE